ncbi:MAG: amino acid ABC transporter substrate-binding protein [Pseudomonadota bacterium]
MTRTIAVALAALVAMVSAATAQTLKTVRDRGQLICGVSEGLPGFSAVDDKSQWSGLDVDLCRAIAAAIFNDPSKVQFVGLSAGNRFEALSSKRIDVLVRNSTWTMERDAGLGLIFAAVNYYDGQGFMVRKALKIDTALELADKSICTQSGTTNELNLADYFRNNRLTYKAVTLPTADEALKAYDSGRCDAFTSDVSQLHALRIKLANPLDQVVLPEVISKEPLGPAVRQDDVQWLNIVKWTHFAMINAEELNVSRATLDEALKSQKPDVRRLLGLEGNLGEQLGLTKDWAARIVRLVGNYGDAFERNVGADSKLAIPRGLNSLWDRGGIQYAPPVR